MYLEIDRVWKVRSLGRKTSGIRTVRIFKICQTSQPDVICGRALADYILNPTPTPTPDYTHQVSLSPPIFLNFRHPCTLLSQSAQCPKPFLEKWMASQMVSERNFFKVTELLSTALEKQWCTEVHFVFRKLQKLKENLTVVFLIHLWSLILLWAKFCFLTKFWQEILKINYSKMKLKKHIAKQMPVKSLNISHKKSSKAIWFLKWELSR